MTNGAWLRWKRQRADLGLREMGRRVGFTAVYLSDIERGNRNCPPKVRDAYDRL
jgi:transcriptional regulator with XRE-family HTH domain